MSIMMRAMIYPTMHPRINETMHATMVKMMTPTTRMATTKMDMVQAGLDDDGFNDDELDNAGLDLTMTITYFKCVGADYCCCYHSKEKPKRSVIRYRALLRGKKRKGEEKRNRAFWSRRYGRKLLWLWIKWQDCKREGLLPPRSTCLLPTLCISCLFSLPSPSR